ncbi:hypothetical protein Pcinc_008161 [Petrolisthes cinctipes]|uniref:THAP-type domain-containing protein n=1 Tax=Petrolisthes cinctipes TaxID=88211 RepID=A0AAE1KXI7_PETCI|nr:hypothetical protein Pcinc_008161 [Petrolisthes cinctipes]
MWINAVKRAAAGSTSKVWKPSQHDRLCSAHFISGKKSDDSLAPDFVPSVFSFTSSPRKRKAEVALQRFQRRQNFSKLKEDSKPSHEEAKGNCSDMENELPSESDSDTLSITSDMLDYEQGANVALDKDCKYLREQNHHLNDNLSKLSLTENAFQNDEKDTHPLTMLQSDDSGLTCLDKCVRVACALVNMCPSVVPFD